MALQGIRINTVSPGMTDTDMIADKKATVDVGNVIPMGRVGEPSEIADAVSYLVSEKASYVAGERLHVVIITSDIVVLHAASYSCLSNARLPHLSMKPRSMRRRGQHSCGWRKATGDGDRVVLI